MTLTIELSTGRRLEFEGETILIGRDTSCAVSLPDEIALQPRHAKISRVSGQWLIGHVSEGSPHTRVECSEGVC